MNIKKLKYILPALLLTFVFYSCEKIIEYKVLSGSMVGFVILSGNSADNNSGVEITMEGIEPGMSAFSDEDGKFAFDNIPFGTYNFIYHKDGYGTYRMQSVSVVGGSKPSTLGRVPLHWIPRVSLTDLGMNRYNLYQVDYVGVHATVIEPYEGEYCSYYRYYLGRSSDVSYSNYTSTGYLYNPAIDYMSGIIRIDTLQFLRGTEIFAIFYPTGEPEINYMDLNTGKDIYTSINIDGASEVISYMIP